jgi:hypothetical protein
MGRETVSLKRWLGRLFPREAASLPPWQRAYDPAATLDDIFFCFRLILGRAPNPEEWLGHALQAGAPLAGVVGGYLNSLEFFRRGLLDKNNMDDVRLIELPDFKIHVAESDAAVGRHVGANNYELDVTSVFRQVLKPGMGIFLCCRPRWLVRWDTCWQSSQTRETRVFWKPAGAPTVSVM